MQGSVTVQDAPCAASRSRQKRLVVRAIQGALCASNDIVLDPAGQCVIDVRAPAREGRLGGWIHWLTVDLGAIAGAAKAAWRDLSVSHATVLVAGFGDDWLEIGGEALSRLTVLDRKTDGDGCNVLVVRAESADGLASAV